MIDRPLGGIRVAVTRPEHQAQPLVAELKAAGADVLVAPLIVIADPESFEPLDAAVQRLVEGHYHWVVFTSVNSVLKVLTRLGAVGSTWQIRADIAAVGPATADVLQSHQVPVRVIPQRSTGVEAAAAIGPGPGAVLLPRVEGGPRDIVEALAALGWDIDEVPAYRNLPAGPESPGIDRIIAGEFDVITLTSASAARSLAAFAQPLPDAVVACIGPSTAVGARAAGLRVDVVADEHTAPGLVNAIIDHVRGMAR